MRSQNVSHVVQSVCIVLGVIGTVGAALVYLTWGQAAREGILTQAVAVLSERTSHNERDIADLHKLTTDELRRITDAMGQLRTDVVRNERRR